LRDYLRRLQMGVRRRLNSLMVRSDTLIVPHPTPLFFSFFFFITIK